MPSFPCSVRTAKPLTISAASRLGAPLTSVRRHRLTIALRVGESCLYESGRQFDRKRSAMADITDSANVGVS